MFLLYSLCTSPPMEGLGEVLTENYILMVFYMAFNGDPAKDMEKEIICLIT